MKKPASYRGKLLTLDVRIDERIPRNKSLRDYVGRSVQVAALGPKGEQWSIVITIPPGLSVPDVGEAADVRVSFICTRGDLRQGNEAKMIERR